MTEKELHGSSLEGFENQHNALEHLKREEDLKNRRLSTMSEALNGLASIAHGIASDTFYDQHTDILKVERENITQRQVYDANTVILNMNKIASLTPAIAFIARELDEEIQTKE